MRSGTRSLCVLFLLGSACSQIIGLGDYDKTDGTEGQGGNAGNPSGGTGAGAGTSGSGGVSRGGTSTGDAGGGAGGVGAEGGSADAGRGGSLPTGGTTSSGGTSISGGVVGEGGGGVTGTGGLDAGAGGVGGDGGGGGTGITGGTGGTAGKGGSGGTSGGTAGKGGSGGTSGGTAGKGGSGGTCTTAELLQPDGNFDAQSGLWSENPTPPPPLICTTACFTNPNTLAPHSGTRFLWLGGAPDAIQWVDRTITVPPGTVSVALDCYFWTASGDSTTVANDNLYIDLIDVDGDIVETLAELDNTQEHTAWTHLTFSAQATTFVGTPVAIEFYAETNDTLNTNFFVDTCALRATVCN